MNNLFFKVIKSSRYDFFLGQNEVSLEVVRKTYF